MDVDLPPRFGSSLLLGVVAAGGGSASAYWVSSSPSGPCPWQPGVVNGAVCIYLEREVDFNFNGKYTSDEFTFADDYFATGGVVNDHNNDTTNGEPYGIVVCNNAAYPGGIDVARGGPQAMDSPAPDHVRRVSALGRRGWRDRPAAGQAVRPMSVDTCWESDVS